MNQTQARVVDPVLTDHARGYAHPARVGHVLFPTVDVDYSGGKVIEFGKEAFQLYNIKRAPGAHVMQITFGYEGKEYSLAQESLDAVVPEELAQEAELPGVNLGMRAVSVVMDNVTLSLEVEQAALATDLASYPSSHRIDLDGGSQWTSSGGTPIESIETAMDVVRQSTGMRPNTILFSAKAYKAFKNAKTVKDRFKNTSPVITRQLIAQLFEVEKLVVADAVYADDAGTFHDVWGNSVIIAYAPEKSEGHEQPSYGYTYRMKRHPFVRQAHWDRSRLSWVYGVTYARRPVLTGILAGYLIKNPAVVS